MVAHLFFPTVYGRKLWTKLVDEKKVLETVHAGTEALFIATIESKYSRTKNGEQILLELEYLVSEKNRITHKCYYCKQSQSGKRKTTKNSKEMLGRADMIFLFQRV